MRLSGHSRALRAVMVACGLVWFGPAELRAAAAGSPGSRDLIQKSVEPFGLSASVLSGGGLHRKWQGVQRRLDDEMVQLALGGGDTRGCVSPAALQFLAIIDAAKLRDGRARLGLINRAINLAIRPV